MQLTSILLLALSAASISNGWKIPQGQGDGVYRVEARDDGTLEHTLLAPRTSHSHLGQRASKARAVRAAPVSKYQRDLTFPEATTCRGYTLNAQDNNNAFNGLVEQCHGVPSLTALGIYSISNDVVVYWCNYPTQACADCNPAGQSCSATDAGISLQTYLAGECGSFVAGWTTWARESYGQESVSQDPGFCGNGIHN
jgi:hypothetical protein